jgi:hypothetical protein
MANANKKIKEVWIMAKIVGVMADYDALPVFGSAITINLDNKQTIFLSLESKADDPAFDRLRDEKLLVAVKTDGESIYWTDGPRLTFDEIIKMLRESD